MRIQVLTAGLGVLWLAGAAGAAPAPEDTPLPEGKETTVGRKGTWFDLSPSDDGVSLTVGGRF